MAQKQTVAPKKKSHKKSAASQSPLSLERYSRPPVLDVPAALALAEALGSACPKGASAAVKAALALLSAAADSLSAAWKAKNTDLGSPESRTADQQLDHAWASLHDRIESFAGLPPQGNPLVARAKEILSVLFPDGLRFLRIPYDKEWAESRKTLDLIGEKGYLADINTIAGAPFLAEVQAAHAHYGVVLNITQPGQPPSPPKELAQRLRALLQLLPQYAIRVIAAVDPSSAKSASDAEAALQPFVDARQVHHDAVVRAKEAREQKAEAAKKPDPPKPPEPLKTT